ncbi:protein TIC 62, chloroplastic isoform X2 [Pistacia vera]|uniref:protein TIC 62, chloroplastic isoform X2 n=1 Tax=Pistacia vera TaxID=55513 RepID=UPI001263AE75|nr:protein TIC 62, chloroplastic isoform X2 [Pistacia vera]
MATELFFTPIPNLPHPFVKFPENPLRIPLFALPPLTISSGFCSLKTVSSSRGRSSSAVHAVQEEVIQAPNSDSQTAPPSSSKLVLVVGGTGGVGQLIVASLLSRNIKARLLLRDPEKATILFGKQDEEKLQVCKGDTRNPEDVDPSIFEGVTHVICCTGTTAFPSKRWDGDNTPERVDWEGVRNLVSALPSSLKRIVLVSSVGVTKFNEIPWSIMNLFGVLKYKKMGEDFLRNSGLPFTIIRPGRLTDGPYTSYDLNTLLKATAGQRRAVLIGKGDKLVGEVSRLVVAEACIQALDIDFTEGEIYEINSVEGEGPGNNPQKWRELFKAAGAQ